jgi:glycine cleavage system H lipoate-binding protein
MDDFASKLTGKLENITLPQRGQWIRQGQKLCTIYHDDAAVDMVSPIEGTVSDINQAVLQNPKLALSDPYGDGWLVTVNAPDAKTSFKNLLGGPLARWWTEESASRLQRRIPVAMAFAGALAQDGGEAINDVAAQIPDQEWAPLAKEFFLS